mmetsp:Transcript_21387/g.52645  ORF Transcript_21387/g.52645 Transcript_21387/m.52645 type:complete len:209 (-) Transcript_21387:2096-2722(-)
MSSCPLVPPERRFTVATLGGDSTIFSSANFDFLGDVFSKSSVLPLPLSAPSQIKIPSSFLSLATSSSFSAASTPFKSSSNSSSSSCPSSTGGVESGSNIIDMDSCETASRSCRSVEVSTGDGDSISSESSVVSGMELGCFGDFGAFLGEGVGLITCTTLVSSSSFSSFSFSLLALHVSSCTGSVSFSVVDDKSSDILEVATVSSFAIC